MSSLLERYTAATSPTLTVVKGLGESAAQGVNFTDGVPRTAPGPDVVQTEFKPNAAGDFKYGGGGKTPAATNNKSYPLSRWLARGVEKGDAYLTNPRFTTISDVRNGPGTVVHNYSPFAGKDFTTTLPEMTKGRVNGSASGPSPSGVAG
jgi:hypothetical protein